MDITRCMSTQHPDNASVPFFASSPVLAGEDEIREAYYCYSHLGCDEQMWDVEGKEIDPHVVKKLLTFYPEFFRKHILGRDLRLTVRVPNPSVERAEAKILLETLESIPRSFDAARAFYGDDAPPPIFEVILPMTTSARCLNRVYSFYQDFIIGRQHRPVLDGDITVAEWIGDFGPARINVIPLFEDIPTMLRAGEILADFLDGKEVEYQRVFLARSDTAMNYGLAAAALANKIALQQLYETGERTGVPICPIIGMGSAPFRGGLSPRTVERVSGEYPSVVTFTIQSAFKFDNPAPDVNRACDFLKRRTVSPPPPVDEERARALIENYSAAYRRRIVEIAPFINAAARFVPARRAQAPHRSFRIRPGAGRGQPSAGHFFHLRAVFPGLPAGADRAGSPLRRRSRVPGAGVSVFPGKAHGRALLYGPGEPPADGRTSEGSAERRAGVEPGRGAHAARPPVPRMRGCG